MLSIGRFQPTTLRSPLSEVTDRAWEHFWTALEIQPVRTVSSSGGLGAFELRPRRLVELGHATNLRLQRSEASRQIFICDFLRPWTQARFLDSYWAQYGVLKLSTKQYHDELRQGKLQKPKGLSLAGTLAILHRGGRGALADWPDLFERTRRVFEAAQGAF